MEVNNNNVIILLDDDDDDDDNNSYNNDISNSNVRYIDKNATYPNSGSREELSNEVTSSFFLPHELNMITMIKEVLNIEKLVQQHNLYNNNDNTTIDHLIYEQLQKFSWNIENTIDFYLMKQQQCQQQSENNGKGNAQNNILDCLFTRQEFLLNGTSKEQNVICQNINNKSTTNMEQNSSIDISDEILSHKFVSTATIPSSTAVCLSNCDVVSISNSNTSNGIKGISATTDAILNNEIDNKNEVTNTKMHLTDADTIPPTQKYYIDPDFPPDSSSLDGRQRIVDKSTCSTSTISSNSLTDVTKTDTTHDKKNSIVAVDNTTNYSIIPSITHCYCGYIAAAKRVQSDGPNYGRFYLSCGQTSLSFMYGRRQQAVQKKDTRSDYNKNNKKDNNQTITTFVSTPTKRKRRAPVVVVRKDSPALLLQNKQNDNGNNITSSNNCNGVRKALFESDNTNKKNTATLDIKVTPLDSIHRTHTSKLVNPYAKKKDTTVSSSSSSSSATIAKATGNLTTSDLCIDVAISSPSTNTTTVSPPQQWKQPCKFFQWDNDGSKGAINNNNIGTALSTKKDIDKNDIMNSSNSGYSISNRKRKIRWYHFGTENKCTLYKYTINVDHIRQGSVGNCWFLSALAVVAEKTWLVDKILHDCTSTSPTTTFDTKKNEISTTTSSFSSKQQLNDFGQYRINLCIDGKWQSIVIDSYLPVVLESNYEDIHGSQKRLKSASPSSSQNRRTKKLRLDVKNIVNGVRVIKKNDRNASMTQTGLLQSDQPQKQLQHNISNELVMAFPAFCGTPKRQLWPALIEKAYAKVHGSYSQLSAGFIKEGLQDLTGAPTETIVFHQYFNAVTDMDSLWQRLLSYNKAGFVMGIATAVGGQGLVGGHAYSILDVIQISDTIIGEQSKVTDYFHRSISGNNDDKAAKVEVADLNEVSVQGTLSSTENVLRIIRIRNPWGEREWKGDWSYNSERWTSALRAKIGIEKSYAQNDGTFFMSYNDMIHKFHHMDVAKTRQGWIHSSYDGSFRRYESSSNPLLSSEFVYQLRCSMETPIRTCISIVLPKKRSNSNSAYWYCDPSIIVFRKCCSDISNFDNEIQNGEGWVCETCIISGVTRDIHCELILLPGFVYCCFPWSLVGANVCNDRSYPFRFTIYSNDMVSVRPISNEFSYSTIALNLLHKEVLNREPKLIYPISYKCAIICVHGDGCVYFIAVNGTNDHYLSIKLSIDEQDGIICTQGLNVATYDIPPLRQQIISSVSRDGRQNSIASTLVVHYLSSMMPVRKDTTPLLGLAKNYSRTGNDFTKGRVQLLANSVELSFAGVLLVESIDNSDVQMARSFTIDIVAWIPQLGCQNRNRVIGN